MPIENPTSEQAPFELLSECVRHALVFSLATTRALEEALALVEAEPDAKREEA